MYGHQFLYVNFRGLVAETANLVGTETANLVVTETVVLVVADPEIWW